MTKVIQPRMRLMNRKENRHINAFLFGIPRRELSHLHCTDARTGARTGGWYNCAMKNALESASRRSPVRQCQAGDKLCHQDKHQ